MRMDFSTDTSVSDNRPAAHRRAVVLTCDNRFFPFATLLASQIATAFPEDRRDFDICILTNDNLPDHPLVGRFGLRIVRFEMPESWTGLKVTAKFSHATYLRIAAPRLLAADYDRLLYLDSDILFLRGDISALLSCDLGGRPVGAVLDNLHHRSPKKAMIEFKAVGRKTSKYFNAGVLLIDVARYLSQDIEKKTFAYAVPELERYMHTRDQSMMNLALAGNWAELAPQWNFPSFHRYFFFLHWADPCFLHFMSSRKPWSDANGLYSAAVVRIYRDHLEEHFPETARTMPARPKVGARPWLWRAVFLRHMLDYRRLARYLDRFTSDFDIQ